jgi:hypothetical protein
VIGSALGGIPRTTLKHSDFILNEIEFETFILSSHWLLTLAKPKDAEGDAVTRDGC